MLTLERKWDRRVQQWHSHVTSAVAFEQLLEDMLKIAAPRPADACVDLGAGTGFVTTALAPLTSSVLAVDISGAMASALAARAQQDGLGNVSTQVGDLSTFDLRPSSTDLVVSSYALHHLVDADKRALVTRSAQWLRPGGRLVIADMMFGRGASRRDRDILRQKVLALAAKGPGGWWRIAKNLVRYGLGVGQEHPATPEFWQAALRDAGFTDVTFHPVVAEAGIVSGVRSGGLPVIAAGATRPSSLMHASTRPPGKSRSLSRTDHGSCPGDPSSACLLCRFPANTTRPSWAHLNHSQLFPVAASD